MADLSDYPGSFNHVLWSRHAWLFHNKTKKESVKDYGAIFTCMSCQAVHIEITHSHLLIALRHLIASREKVQQSSWTMVAVSLDLRHQRKWRRNFSLLCIMWLLGYLKKEPPLCRSYDHIHGVQKDQIHSTSSIISSVMQKHRRSLVEESLAKLSRPYYFKFLKAVFHN